MCHGCNWIRRHAAGHSKLAGYYYRIIEITVFSTFHICDYAQNFPATRCQMQHNVASHLQSEFPVGSLAQKWKIFTCGVF